jgi:hypothetical protein
MTTFLCLGVSSLASMEGEITYGIGGSFDNRCSVLLLRPLLGYESLFYKHIDRMWSSSFLFIACSLMVMDPIAVFAVI